MLPQKSPCCVFSPTGILAKVAGDNTLQRLITKLDKVGLKYLTPISSYWGDCLFQFQLFRILIIASSDLLENINHFLQFILI